MKRTDPPDWDAISHEVLCPLCEYNLRGLSEGRCPECGYRFEWSVITDPAARPHPFAFENHPERNVRSFFRTLLGTITPTRFWKSLSPMQPSRPGRLIAYAVIYSVLTVFILIAYCYWEAADSWQNAGMSPSPYTLRRIIRPPAAPAPTSFTEKLQIAREVFMGRRDLRVLRFYTVLWLIWPWLTLLSLAVFQISARRAKIKAIHVLRCVVYSFDMGAWLGIIFGLAAAVSVFLPWPVSLVDEGSILFVFTVLFFMGFFRMWRAYEYYLKFDHPFLTVLSVAIMTFMVGLNICVYLEPHWVRR